MTCIRRVHALVDVCGVERTWIDQERLLICVGIGAEHTETDIGLPFGLHKWIMPPKPCVK